MIKVKAMIEREIELPVDIDEEFTLNDGISRFRLHTPTDLQQKENNYGYAERNNNEWKPSSLITISDLADDDFKITRCAQEPFWPDEEDVYYYIDKYGEVDVTFFTNSCLIDLLNARIGNCFRTSRISEDQLADFKYSIKHKEIIEL
jgi:hypothetical protein